MHDVIIALDFPTLEQTLTFLQQFKEESLFVKIGMELYLQNGPKVIEVIQSLGHRIFLDLKLHDIPNTVYGAAKGLAAFHVDILTVHCAGGKAMLSAAKRGMIEGGSPHTSVIGITQLTSTSEAAMHQEQLIQVPLKESVGHYAQLAKEAGLDGVVASVHEASFIHEKCGHDFLIVTPGIRLEHQEGQDDQQRVATPTLAINQGATHIVVGRPITQAVNPVAAYHQFKQSFQVNNL